MPDASGWPSEHGEVTLSDDGAGVQKYAHWTCPNQHVNPRPDGSLRVCTVPLTTASPKGWQFDGNREAPTLMPSIRCYGCAWHGWIRAGKLVND
jgi:hypothetical protein